MTEKRIGDDLPTQTIAEESEPGNPRLDRWVERTTTPLDLIALFTIWLTVIPLGDLHNVGKKPILWFAGRILVSFIYFIDIFVRTALSHRKLRYLITHPVGIVAVVFPAIRLIFSLRLLGAMFRKGNLAHFLFVSLVLLLNLTIIVYGFEHNAHGANIVSMGDAVWWSCVTVFTVGYGDFYPVTTGGRFFAVAIMALGLLTAAVITAQIASSFMDQAAARRARASGSDASTTPVAPSGDLALSTMMSEMRTSINERLDSIDARLHHVTPAETSDGDQT